MDRRERFLSGNNGFDKSWWIFDVSFSVKKMRYINNPVWLGLVLCKLNKHDWWIKDLAVFSNPVYKCSKCGKEE